MSQIVIGQHRFDAKPESATLIQQAIDSMIAESKARADAATTDATKAKADAAKATKRADGVVKAAKAKLGAVRTKLDALRNRKVKCDECGGKGKVFDAKKDPGQGEQETVQRRAMFAHMREQGYIDAEGNMKLCDGCAGTGFMKHGDVVKSQAPAEGEEGAPDEDMEEAGEEAKDDDLERESLEEEKLERAANPEHKDRARARRDARLAAQKRRADSIARMVEREAWARATLLTLAGRHLGTETRLDGKGNEAIGREMLAKLAPHVDAAKLPARDMWLLLESEVARADAAAAPQFTASDQLRAGIGAPAGAPRNGGAVPLRTRADAMESAWQHPLQQPKLGPQQ